MNHLKIFFWNNFNFIVPLEQLVPFLTINYFYVFIYFDIEFILCIHVIIISWTYHYPENHLSHLQHLKREHRAVQLQTTQYMSFQYLFLILMTTKRIMTFQWVRKHYFIQIRVFSGVLPARWIAIESNHSKVPKVRVRRPKNGQIKISSKARTTNSTRSSTRKSTATSASSPISSTRSTEMTPKNT